MNKYYILAIAIFMVLSTFSFCVNAQTYVVRDENGNAIANATVTFNDGNQVIAANENGEFSLEKANPSALLLIEADGYDSKMVELSELLSSNNTVVLNKPIYQMGQREMVNLPFGSLPQRLTTGSVGKIDVQEILNYDQQKSLNDLLTGRISGMFGPANLRNNGGTPLIVVDGIPRMAEDLNLQQIEQIVVVKDLSSAMLYGPQARHGVILVTTKHGKPLKKEFRFTAESGIMKGIRYPRFLPAGEYMMLYNEARENDGLLPLYSDEVIENTIKGVDPVRYPDEDYYTDVYLKGFNSFKHVVAERAGGNEIANYYLNLGWKSEDSFLKIGEGNNESNNRLNLRTNINYKITDHIDFKFDGLVLFNLYNGPRYTNGDFWNLSTTLLPNYAPVLIPADLIEDQDLLSSAKLIDGKYLLGGTSEYQTNIYGEFLSNGFSRRNGRYLNLNPGLFFDLSSIVPGLTANVNLSLDWYNLFNSALNNTYRVYQVFYGPDNSISSVSAYGQDLRVDNMTITGTDFNRRNVLFGNVNYEKEFSGDQNLLVSAVAYYDNYVAQGQQQPLKQLYYGIRGNYAYKNKYMAEVTGTLAYSGKLLEGNHPYAISPGFGLGWVVSEESFMNTGWINYLKVKANWANLHSDQALGYYYYEDTYSSGSSFSYSHGQFSNTARVLNMGNPDLKWEMYANSNFGFESRFLDYRIGFDFNYFHIKSYDLISQPVNSLPAFFASAAYQNYGKNKVEGIEMNLDFSERIGQLKFNIGSNFTYAVPKTLVIDEIDYEEDYRKQTGKATDAIFGWEAIGLFKDQDEINNHAIQTFGPVQPGDIKYKDLNHDGVIDDLDQTAIGNSKPRAGYGLHLNLEFKNFEFFALATGNTGQERIFQNPYYWVFGERKYSEVVRNRWTPETAETATYPRLTTGSGSNNFRPSTFWIEKNNWLRFNTAQLNYTLSKIGIAGIKEAKLYARAYNLFNISEIKEKTELNIGAPPQTRDISFGMIVNF